MSKKFQLVYTVQLPAWSLCALINNDESGLEDDEIQQIDDWEKTMVNEYGILTYNVISSEPYFCADPEFGLAGCVYDVEIWATY
jgi:hypothetical protein